MSTKAMAINGTGISGGEYSIWRVIMASSVGTMIEWYDFYIFGSLAAFLSPKFYPPGNDTFALIAYLATFAVGFVVRPFGALFFGRIGDLIGRKYAFLVTLSIMGFSTYCRCNTTCCMTSRRSRCWRSACCRDSRWAENMAAQRSMWASMCLMTSAASTPASFRSRPHWVCSFR